MIKFRKISTAALMLSALLLASTAKAATWTEINNPSTSGFTVGSNSVTYGPVAANEVWVYDGSSPLGAQSPAAIQSLVSTQFGLPTSGAGSLVLASQGDDLLSGKSGTFNVSSAFSYLAIHYGNDELLFHWDQPLAANTAFSFGNLPRGISNYRAFTSVSAVPEPATYGMLFGGLGLIGFIARRRKRV